VSSSQLGGPWNALAAGRVREARNAFAAIVVQAPERAEAWLGLTLALWHGGDRFAALGTARKAHATDPDALDPQLVLGSIQRQIGDIDGARATLESARERHPDNADLLRLLSDVYRRARRTADAMDAAERALALDGTSTQNLVCFGDAMLAAERFEGAEKAYRVALAVEPQDVRAAFGLGRVALLRGDWLVAQAAFEHAHAIAPHDADVRYILALLHLRFGRYAQGYAAYPAIMDTASDEARYYYHHEGVPLWHGEPLAGRRLVIAADQGFGDHLMMARFFDRLPSDAEVVVETPPPLLGLFARTFPHVRFTRFTHWQPAYTMDVHLPITQLPRIARVSGAGDIPGAPYLHADPDRVADWRARLAADPGVRHVGIVWHGNRHNTRERWRGAPLDAWAPLAALTGVRFHALQFGAGEDELAAAPFPLVPAHRAIADFDDLAAAMTALDAIVTVDTAAVHLAGALGRPTWLANPFISDYRWGIDAETSPWYPTVSIIRQPAPDAWHAVFQRIAAALRSTLPMSCFDYGSRSEP
jgi:tetratricopeptide (TPR) repeat protein